LTLTAADLHVTRAGVEYEWNALDAARHHLHLAQQVGRLGEYRGATVRALALMTQVCWAHGDSAGAWAALTELEEIALGPGVPAWLIGEGTWQRAWLELAQAGPTSPPVALAWALQDKPDVNAPLNADDERGHLLLARVLLQAPDRRIAGLRLLERLLAAAEAAGRTQRVIAILALQAVGLAQIGDDDRALAVLARALALGESEGFVRSFLDLGPPMVVLLRRFRARQRRSGASADPALSRPYLSRLLASRTLVEPAQRQAPSGAARGAVVEPLTAREIDVLRLVAAGATNKEIARRLVMAEATAKTHLTHLYGKLGVSRRTEAVARARALGLLS
jgi:LuxR family maltose regulon positive regulatory protein